MTSDPVIPAPAQRVDHPDPLEEIHRLKQHLGRLAQKCGIDFDEGADATAVLQEVERRVGESSGKRSSGGIFSFPSLRDVLASMFNKTYADVLKRPGRLGSATPITEQSIPLGSAAPVTQQFIPPESRSLTEEVRYKVGQYRLWAVLIGIDAYTQDPLRGCVSDVSLIKRFLTDDLGVPENRIQCLLGSKDPNFADPKSIRPTRTNIVDTIYSLANNPEIGRGDNIIIYYAGHGSMYHCTTHEFESPCDKCPIETLCPIDRDTQDADGNWIPDISDREVNILLTLMCRAKGHKITVILDCGMNGGPRQRGIRGTAMTHNASLESMLHTADERWKDLPGYRSVLSKDWWPDMDSFVALAACRGYQFAFEVEDNNEFGGVFSKELVRVLRSTDCKEMTYVDLINCMRGLCAGKQTPFAGGNRKNERLWN